jgi:hypothetical protein
MPSQAITQADHEYVRWYCFEALYQGSCAIFNSCDDNHDRPTGFKDVGTAERSRCDFEPKSVRVRIEKQRKFQIECSSESTASNGDAVTKATIRLYDGVWRPDDSAEIQWYGQTYDEYQKKNADPWNHNWRIYLVASKYRIGAFYRGVHDKGWAAHSAETNEVRYQPGIASAD